MINSKSSKRRYYSLAYGGVVLSDCPYAKFKFHSYYTCILIMLKFTLDSICSLSMFIYLHNVTWEGSGHWVVLIQYLYSLVFYYLFLFLSV